MLLGEMHSKKDAIIALAQQHGARRIRVFGSVARREEATRRERQQYENEPR